MLSAEDECDVLHWQKIGKYFQRGIARELVYIIRMSSYVLKSVRS
jgi:hypothetical protein